jgi:hypothetical protein
MEQASAQQCFPRQTSERQASLGALVLLLLQVAPASSFATHMPFAQ